MRKTYNETHEKIERTKLRLCLLFLFFIAVISPLSGEELRLSVGAGPGIMPGTFSEISLLNMDGTLGLGLYKLFDTPLNAVLEMTYAEYLVSEDASGWIEGLHGLQGVLLFGFHWALGENFVLTPRIGAGMQFLFSSSAVTYDDYQNGIYTERFGSQLLFQGCLAADFILSGDWNIGIEGGYRLLAEEEGLHHGALARLMLSRKIAEPGKQSNSAEASEPSPEPEPAESRASVNLSSLNGIENLRAFQTGSQVTIILLNSFSAYDRVLTEQAAEHLSIVGEFLQGLQSSKIVFCGYVADIQEDEAEVDSELSLSRAVAVRDWLLLNGYIDESKKTEVEGGSSDNPVGDNTTSEGRALNRRVEIIIDLDGEGGK